MAGTSPAVTEMERLFRVISLGLIGILAAQRARFQMRGTREEMLARSSLIMARAVASSCDLRCFVNSPSRGSKPASKDSTKDCSSASRK